MSKLVRIKIREDCIMIKYTFDKLWYTMTKNISIKNKRNIDKDMLKQIILFIFVTFNTLFDDEELIDSAEISILFRLECIIFRLNDHIITIYENDAIIDGTKEIKNWRTGYLPDIRIFV